MAERVFFLNTLKEGVDPQAYEEWVRQVDYPVARRQPAIVRYEVTRIEGRLNGDEPSPCQYLEVIDVTSIDEYRASLDGNAELEALLAEWAEYVAESTIVYGPVLS
jgi:hypothetical protein